MKSKSTQELEALLRQLEERHARLERKIEQFNQHVFLSPREQTERKRLQKLKLATRDQSADIQHELAQRD